jgi:hypothetical protein
MRRVIGYIGFFIFAGLLTAQQISPSQARSRNGPSPTIYAIVNRDANSRVWQHTTYSKNQNGQIVTNSHSYTELASGLNHLVNGQWVESKDEIDLLPNGGAAATNGQHQAYFPADIYNGQIELITPDGQQLQSQPVGLNYFDGTNFVILGLLTNSVGELVNSNQIMYPDAFTGIKADLRYTYTKAGFEQDIILKEQPLTPESFGLNPDSSRLEVLTEFFDSPQPDVKARSVSTIAGNTEDDSLSFGTMRMKRGKAFLLGTNSPSLGVNKQWLSQDGRQFLVEAVPVNSVVPELLQLPVTQASPLSSKSSSLLNVVSAKRLLPAQHLVNANPIKQPKLIARATAPSQGLVLDYVTINAGYTNSPFTFQSNTTYYINGEFDCNDTATFEGGTIIKFARSSQLYIANSDPIVCDTSADNPAIFTAVDDNSVGETISGSTGSPSGTYADIALNIDFGYAINLQHLRIAYAALGMYSDASFNSTMLDCQFVNVVGGIQNWSAPLMVGNVLFNQVGGYAFQVGGSWSPVVAAHLTLHRVSNFIDPTEGIGLSATNSLFICVTNWGHSFVGAHNVTNTSDSGVFATAGLATHYLATTSSYRDIGTTNIDPDLLADIQQMTTYAPQDGGWPDTNTPDLGYHYSTNEDSDFDGLPDWWEWKYFGSYAYSGTNLDSSGTDTLLDDYENNADPNPISFTVSATNNYVRTNLTSVRVNVSGIPFYQAVLVDDTNYADATWTSYTSTNIAVNLGTNEGWHQIWVGLKGFSSDETPIWQWKRLKLDVTPPQLSITSPTNSTVMQPMIQLQGYSPEELQIYSYDLTNATGLVTNQQVLVTDTYYDTNTWEFTTNYFQCFDVPLTNGVNTFTLHATDRAGNVTVTNFSFTLDYSSKTNPPVLSLDYPQNGSIISGSVTNFTWRGTVDDFNDTLTASMVDTNGMTNSYPVIVERTGNFSAENLPLGSGTNVWTLTATDVVGNVTITNISIIKSSTILTINPVTPGDTTVTGTINSTNYTVWVNRVKATVDTVDENGDGTWNWEADAVPIYPSGGSETMHVRARAILNSDNGGDGHWGPGGGL